MSWRSHLPEIRTIAQSFGLQVRPTEFLVVDADTLYAIAATGLPGMYHHWTHGRDFERERTRHSQGRATIYELVVNLDPAQAFLLDQNADVEHLFVAAHVMGHVDLFGRNVYSRRQRLDIDRVVRAAASRFASYEEEHGETAVEALIDAAHMLRWHSSAWELAPPRRPNHLRRDPYSALFPERRSDPDAPLRQYREDCARYRRGIGESDLLRFLIHHAPLDEWQRDILSVVRDVALYFLPATGIKICHEGWASFWHRRILREISGLKAAAVSDARLNAQVAGHPGGGRVNPYWLGLTILEHLQARGENLHELMRVESDRSLIGRIDERLVYDNEFLRQAAAAVADQAQSQGQPPWEHLRDRLLAVLAVQLPEVEVCVQEWDARRLVLAAETAVDEAYAKQVLTAMASLWQGDVMLVAPRQELHSGTPPPPR